VKDLPGGRTQVLNVRQIEQINRHPAESAEISSAERISDTKNWLNWNGDLDNANNSEDDWEADNESEMEMDNGREDSETLEHRYVSAAPNVPGFIRPTPRSKQQIWKVLMTVNKMEMRRNKGIKKK